MQYLLDYRWTWDFLLGYEDWWLILDERWWYDGLEVMPAWIVIKARILQ